MSWTPLHVVMDATAEPLPGMPVDPYHRDDAHGTVTAIGGIPEGTSAGLASVAVIVTLANGSTVVGETTLSLLNSAARALVARYPDPRP